jgi:flavorubredoxin
MPAELFNNGSHICLGFYDLVDESRDQAVQCNQFLIADQGHGALIDPGGNMTYAALLLVMQRHFPSKQLNYILASHADPDIIASVNKWFIVSPCEVLISSLWTRFVPHFTTGRDVTGRIRGIPDEGMLIPLGNSHIMAIPAHYMHSEGNFQFYDPVAKILFSGDLGVSLVDHATAEQPVADFEQHISKMVGFHSRYMVSNKILRLWVNMVRQLDIEQIVPQHGQRFVGREMCGKLIDWLENLPCGIDLLTQNNYRIPT